MDNVLGRETEVLNDLSRLVPLGILTAPLNVCRFPSPEPEAPDGWHWLPPGLFPETWKWLEVLAYLNAIRLTYSVYEQFVVRVYCVPEDVRKLGVLFDTRGRKAFTSLVDEVNVHPQAWSGHETNFKKALLPKGFSMTLAQIYNDLDSPPRSHSLKDLTHYEKSALYAVEANQVPGLISQLYPYQARSVQSMFLRESYPTKMLDPRLITIEAVTSTLYLELDRYCFWKFPVMYDAPKGFILGEEMGSGKTCECLALILISLDQTPCNPALEPVTNLRLPAPSSSHSGVRSLLDIAAAAVQDHSVPFRWQDLSQSCSDHLEAHKPSYIIPLPQVRTRARRHLQDGFDRAKEAIDSRPGTRIWLSHATLIVVPDTLVSQWRHEINKHVQSDVLRVLVIASTRSRKVKDQIPTAEELLRFDIVLISHSRFSREEEQIGSSQLCNCPYSGRTREIICSCPDPVTYVSPLTTLHWKRLIVDEGHSMSASHTKAVRFASSLYVERKMIVSGTPSRGLVGASADGQEGTQDERFDLEKLAVTTIEFLGLQALDKFSWRKYITKPFLDRAPGAESVVRQLLNSLIVRNRQLDITKDVVLPPLTKKVIFLNATKETVTSLNIFNALIAINAVTSQRIDQDYFFHKSQAGPLQAVVRNMLVSTFHWTGTSIRDVDGALSVAKQALLIHGPLYPSTDRMLLQQSIEVLTNAKTNHLWTRTSENHELSYYLNKALPDESRQYYVLDGTNDLILGGSSVMEAQRAVQEALSVAKPVDVSEDEYLAHKLISAGIKNCIEAAKRVEITVKRKGEPGNDKVSENSAAFSTQGSPQKRSTKRSSGLKASSRLATERNKQISEVVKDITLAGEDLSQSSDLTNSPTKKSGSSASPIAKLNYVEQKGILNKASSLSSMQIVSTSSQKLNYLLTEIRKHSTEEKIIVFSDFVDHTFHLAEALDITGIPYLLYTSRLSSTLKNRYILTFNTSEVFRVIVMDLQLAAHGLNLSSASRVYFIQQCWSGATESQAIKRAHRIGQTRPVHVEILVLRGSIEETMQKRRTKMTGRELGDTKSITDDAVIRNAIESPRFLKEPEIQTFLEPHFPLFCVGQGGGTGEDGLAPIADEDNSPIRAKPGQKFRISPQLFDDSATPDRYGANDLDGKISYKGSKGSNIGEAPHLMILSRSHSDIDPPDSSSVQHTPSKKKRKVLRFAE